MEVFGEEIFDIFKGHDFASIGRVDLVFFLKEDTDTVFNSLTPTMDFSYTQC